MPPDRLETIRRDLAAEQDALDAVVAPLTAAEWDLPTPSEGWAIRDQISHLATFDEAARLAIAEPEAFAAHLGVVATRVAEPGGFDAVTRGDLAASEPAALLDTWRKRRSAPLDAAAGLDPDARVAWYGPPMGAATFLTARLMETWAHGVDITDALDRAPLTSDRLRHVAHLGLLTRKWAFLNRGLPAPETPVRLRLRGPSGDVWDLGEPGADEAVTGDAVDFCLVVTQRRHVDDTSLEATAGARAWLEIAQCFAGPPSDPPRPGSRP